MANDEAAGGLDSVLHTAKHALRAGLTRSLPALRVVNQPEGFDCPGCAWPEASEHGRIEFCENGAKIVRYTPKEPAYVPQAIQVRATETTSPRTATCSCA